MSVVPVYGHPEDGAPAYVRRGWQSPIPIAGKTIPPTGATGREGVVTEADVAGWIVSRAGSNLAVRHEGTVAIDVDDGYGGKAGARYFTAWAAGRRLPDLPATWSSTARGDDSPSRQYVYRVPEGLGLKSKPCTDVEICQRHHRFTVCWPSVHPETGLPYRWYGPGEAGGIPPAWGGRCEPPTVSSLPWLPLPWARALAVARPVRTVVGCMGAGVAVQAADDLLAAFAPGPPTSDVLEKLIVICDPSEHVGHDEAKSVLFSAFMLGLEGHPGVVDLVRAVVGRLSGYLEQARPGVAVAEVTGLVEWCARAAQDKHTANRAFFGFGTGVTP